MGNKSKQNILKGVFVTSSPCVYFNIYFSDLLEFDREKGTILFELIPSTV
jgi:hypothetical protein